MSVNQTSIYSFFVLRTRNSTFFSRCFLINFLKEECEAFSGVFVKVRDALVFFLFLLFFLANKNKLIGGNSSSTIMVVRLFIMRSRLRASGFDQIGVSAKNNPSVLRLKQSSLANGTAVFGVG